MLYTILHFAICKNIQQSFIFHTSKSKIIKTIYTRKQSSSIANMNIFCSILICIYIASCIPTDTEIYLNVQCYFLLFSPWYIGSAPDMFWFSSTTLHCPTCQKGLLLVASWLDTLSRFRWPKLFFWCVLPSSVKNKTF